MATHQASFFCPHCQTRRLFTAHTMNHVPHILASVFLCGLWLPVWILMAMTDNPNYHCSQCGFSDAIRYLNNPNLRQQEAAQRLRTQEAYAGQSYGGISAFVANNEKGLITAGIILGLLGLIVIFSVNTAKNDNDTNDSVKNIVQPRRQLGAVVNVPNLIGKNAKEMDKILGKPRFVGKGTAPNQTIRDYVIGEQLLVKTEKGISISSTFYQKSPSRDYHDILQIGGFDTDEPPREITAQNIITAYVWERLRINGSLHRVTVTGTSGSNYYDVLMVESLK